jgi:sulfoxide reductase heme-binding subunit YedZ
MKAGKHDFANPTLYGVIVAVLLGMRIYWKLRSPKPAPVPERELGLKARRGG